MITRNVVYKLLLIIEPYSDHDYTVTRHFDVSIVNNNFFYQRKHLVNNCNNNMSQSKLIMNVEIKRYNQTYSNKEITKHVAIMVL